MSDNTHPGSEMTRRAIVAGTGVLAVTAALAACSNSPSQGSAAPNAPAEPSGSPGSGAGGALATTSDIPVGGGKVFAKDKVVVTQPAQGTFKAFSAVCTHEGCTVNKVASGTIDCPCHGSKYAIADGSVVHGPASRPLPARQITVSQGEVRLEPS
ncbi:MAG: Rieske (2Fe-2S) protein [Pseudonocardiaceae bacterium]